MKASVAVLFDGVAVADGVLILAALIAASGSILAALIAAHNTNRLKKLDEKIDKTNGKGG